jgi:hypothetical protein
MAAGRDNALTIDMDASCEANIDGGSWGLPGGMMPAVDWLGV